MEFVVSNWDDDLYTTRNDPRPQMIRNFFHTWPEMIPEEL